MGIFDRFFKKKCQHNWELKLPTNNVGDVFENFEGAVEEYCTKCGATRPIPECQHNWQIEQPTHDIGGLMVWEGPVKDYCTKCGARRPHPECNHEWQPAEDDGDGAIVAAQLVRTHICSKCGAELYKKPE